MKYTLTHVVLHSLDSFIQKNWPSYATGNHLVFQGCVGQVLQYIWWVHLWILEKVLCCHNLPPSCQYFPRYLINYVAYMVCISASFYLACKFIQASKSTSSYSEHTTYSQQNLLRLLLNPSVKCITNTMLTEDPTKLLSLFPNSEISKLFPTYAHPIAPFNCRSLHPCTGLNNHRPGYFSPHPGTFLMYLHQV